MAPGEALQQFCPRQPGVRDVFYATTPPGVLMRALESGGLSLGDLFIGVRPHVFISSRSILAQLIAKRSIASYVPFARSRGTYCRQAPLPTLLTGQRAPTPSDTGGVGTVAAQRRQLS